MKTSQTVILAALAVVALGMVLAAGLAHVALSQTSSDSSATSRSFDLTGFSGIETGGRWRVTVTRSDTWQVQVTYPAYLADDMRVRVEGDRLILGTDHDRSYREPLTAKVSMPILDSLSGGGSANFEFAGFSGDRLRLTISGSGDVTGKDGRYTDLDVSVSGSGHIDLRAVPTVDADVNVSGSGHVLLDMDGGELTGSISGSGHIDYAGMTRRQNVRTSGSGRVTQTN